MKKKATKLIAVILTALMLLSMLPVTASAAEATMDSVGSASGTTGDCTWTLVDRVLTISGNGAMGNYNPISGGDYPPAPWMEYAINKVVIENGVTSIGLRAFFGCDGITSVTIPNSVKTIRSEAFEDCSSLPSISIPNSVTSIGTGAFLRCRSLEFVKIPNSVTSIGSGVFEGCSSLISVYIPSSVKSIGSFAFYDCTGMTFAVIPNSVQSIGNFAFGYYGDNQEKKVNGFTIYGYQNSAAQPYANNNGFPFVAINGYDGCGNCILVKKSDGTMIICGKGEMGYTPVNYNFGSYMDGDTKVIIMDGITDISSTAFFSGRDKLKSIQIPNSVTSIGYSAFHMCTGLTSIVIPDSVATIGVDAFEYCTGLKNLTFGAGFTGITSEKGIISPKLSFKRIFGVGGCSNLESITVNAGNPKYDSRNNCNAVIETASNSLILGCKNTVIPDSVTSIGANAFSDCSGLTAITIPAGVTSIGTNAFSNSPELTIYGKKGSYAETYANANGFTFIEDPSVYRYQVLDDGTAKITGYTGSGGDITIPSAIDGHTVTVIGKDAFRRCTNLTTVAIPETVTSIDDWAFAYSTISAVSIPDSVTSIGSYAFASCGSLTSVTIPDSVNNIGSFAFNWCSGLTTVSIPKSVTSIGTGLFSGCANLSNITVDSNNPSYCSIDGNLYTKNSTTLMQYADGKTASSFTIPDSVTIINNYACANCGNLTTVTIPNAATSIGYNAFSRCGNLSSVNIPDSVKSIGESAFINCTSLTAVTIPKSVTSIGLGALGYYTNNGNQKVDGFTITGYKNSAAETYANENGFNFVMLKEYPDFNYRVLDNGTAEITGYTGNGGAVSIPSTVDGYTVTSIGDNAFYNGTKLTSVTIPNTVTSIGRSSFSGCSSLTAVTIPNSVTSIGNLAFYGCTGLTSVTIPNSVTSVGNWAFNDCDSLTAVTIPETVTNIGYEAFGYLSNGKINGFTITGKTGSAAETYANDNGFNFIEMERGGETGSCHWKLVNGVLTIQAKRFDGGAGLLFMSNYIYPGFAPWSGADINRVVIENGVMNVGTYAFNETTSLSDVSIPDSVTMIGDYAFKDCVNLSEIIIPNSVTKIGCGAFYGCSSLTSIDIPDSVTYIDTSAFEGCSNLSEVNFGNSVDFIGEWVFDGCVNLTSITVDNDNPNYCSIDGNLYNKDGTVMIKYAVGKTAESFAIPNTVTCIDCEAFYEIDNLKTVTLPDSVNRIEDYAFVNCNKLTHVTIPSSVTYIGERAFYGCGTATDDGFTIYGVKGTVAETYATENEIPFISICPHCGSTNFETMPGYPATYDRPGLTDGIYCADCGKWIVPQEIIPKKIKDYIEGDLNDDGVISIDDATILQRFLAEFVELDLKDERTLRRTDANCDGHVNVKDVTKIQRMVAGLV